ncbi:alpha/beta hydrolase [Photobacterium gaetbulicola]|uniref:Putative alpha/beta hydrolase domain-containing protein n=1 Tax=Photobacterium gaetbulicola Gung47 TaxID=658445 RepID=A0A0C5X0F4_9GAMM|nr:alpha/beta hydrolase fold domain-containing protein [Photobacterium gaetbulicola]AJR08775.1 putative alpha/beta hydrolase domain-containing protein [Photobacterium gaetbulicola Gung47]PSU10405.1 alpha/beta hydrolase [Photobacterium gaetbulicola]
MKIRSIVLSLLASSVLASGVMANEDKNNLSLSTNPVPLSTAVSSEFYEFSKTIPAPDLTALEKNIPATNAEWRKMIEARDQVAIERAAKLANDLEVKIEKGTVAGVGVYWITPKTVAPELEDKLFVAVQGGAYMLNSGLASATEAMLIATQTQIPALAIDYRKAPEFPAPAARNDIINVWKELLKTRNADTMVMGGTSAGGSLSVLATQEMNSQRIATPSALYVGTPGVDMTMTGDSRFINEGLDHILGSWRGMSSAMVDAYVGELELNDPVVSPIYGSFDNFPAVYLITGTRDLLLSDTVRLHRELKRAGADAELNVYEGQSHADYIVALGTPESNEHYGELSEFIRNSLL